MPMVLPGRLGGGVENISRTATEQDRKNSFETFGAVQSAAIIQDKFSPFPSTYPCLRARFSTRRKAPEKSVAI